MKSVAVIGGGITGLCAAWQLRQAGLAPVVYEASSRVGGVIRTLRRDGYLAEFGPNTLLETSPRIQTLIQAVGLGGRFQYSEEAAHNRYLVRDRQTLPVPGSPLAFLRTPLFSSTAKLKLFLEPFAAKAQAEESIASFVRRRLGEEFLQYAIDPLVSGIYAGSPEQLSVPHAFPKIGQLEARYGSLILGQILGARERKRRGEVSKAHAKKVSFDEGLEVLPQALSTSLGEAVRLQCPVQAATRLADGRWQVAFGAAGQAGQGTHDAVLVCTTAHDLARMQLGLPAPCDLSLLGEILYPPVTSVVLGFRRDQVRHPLDGFGVLVPSIEKLNILGTLFSSSLFPGRAPAGHVTLTTYVGGVRNPALALRGEDELVNLTVQDLAILLGVTGQPTFRHVVVYPQAIPQYNVGYGRFRSFMDELEIKAPGLYLAGHYRNGVSLSDSIMAGLAVADRIAAGRS